MVIGNHSFQVSVFYALQHFKSRCTVYDIARAHTYQHHVERWVSAEGFCYHVLAWSVRPLLESRLNQRVTEIPSIVPAVCLTLLVSENTLKHFGQ